MHFNNHKMVLMVAIIISFQLFFIGCSTSKNPVIGKWKSNQISQRKDYDIELTKYTIFEFTTDGVLKLGNIQDKTIEWKKEELKYMLLDNNTIQINGQNKVEFRYKIKSDEMILMNDSIEIQLIRNNDK
jgi:hypothetical protein